MGEAPALPGAVGLQQASARVQHLIEHAEEMIIADPSLQEPAQDPDIDAPYGRAGPREPAARARRGA